MTAKNEQFEIRITDMSDQGAGIGKADGFTWFVKDAVIGDRVIAAATKVKKNYGFARLVRILEASADRTEAPCTVAKSCGGCQIQQMEYAAQLAFKENKVRGDLERIGGFKDLSGVFEPIIGMEDPFRYRNKTVYPVGMDRQGKLTAGFYAARTHSIIECRDCLLGAAENKEIMDAILSFMEEFDIPPYNETAHSGTVRHVLIRKGHYTGELMVCIVINAAELKAADVLCRRLIDRFPALASFSLCINTEHSNVIMGTNIINIYGPGYIEDIIHEPGAEGSAVRFRISPLSFFQVNSLQMERLYGKALEFAGLTGKENVWDLYCGVGTISLFLARHAKKVYGVEVIPAAVENARENAFLNGISNAEFCTGRAEEVLPAWVRAQEEMSGHAGIDVIVTDPPRKGCDPACLQTMLRLAPARIVYVSCDPATLARDLKYLCENGYRLRRVQPVDMFPHTVHTEVITRLVR